MIIIVYTLKYEFKKSVLSSHLPHLGNKNLLIVKKIQIPCKHIKYKRYLSFIFFIFPPYSFQSLAISVEILKAVILFLSSKSI